MGEREWNRFGLPSAEEQIERECERVESVLWQHDFAVRTSDTGFYDLTR